MTREMIGQATAAAERAPRRWVHRTWGHPYMHKRQDWGVVWPSLAALPERGVRALDAGCGAGWWSLELAARRPHWEVVGVDRDAAALAEAERRRARLGLTNVSFERTEFERYDPTGTFDVVLSVCAAHYAAVEGRGEQPFARAAACLRPGGLLLLYGPRCRSEVPFVPWLPRPAWHGVYTEADLRAFCAAAGLRIESLTPCVGALATVAGQLDFMLDGPARRVALAAGLYAVQVALMALDARTTHDRTARSLMWLLAARTPA